MSNILVVAAHPDDEVLGCGGTIAKYAGLGRKVYVLILGEGISSRYKDRKSAKKEEFHNLKRQAKDAAGILGVKGVFFSDFPDCSGFGVLDFFVFSEFFITNRDRIPFVMNSNAC